MFGSHLLLTISLSLSGIWAGGPLDDCRGFVGIFQTPGAKCSPNYFECDEEENIVELACDFGMIMNPESKACEQISVNLECETELELPKQLDCAGKHGVSYSNPLKDCSVHYYVCMKESVHREKCTRKGQRYDPISQQCLFKEYVEACGGQATTLPPINLPVSRPTSTAVDCQFLPDGDYANPSEKCSNFFIACSNGEPIVKMCGEGTMYDVKSNRCLFKDHIELCGGTATTRNTNKPIVHEVPFVFSCVDREDGLYANTDGACSPDFAQCSNGLVFYHQCAPVNLRFDPEIGECQNDFYVPACDGTRTSRTTTDPNVSRSTAKPTDMNCLGMANGRYPDPINACSERFFTCTGNIAIEQICAPRTKFDHASKTCLFEHFIEVCGGKPTTVAVPVTGEPSTQPTNPDIPFEFECLGRFDGIHADPAGCSSNFVQCANGVGYYKKCHPLSLRYDVLSNQCLAPVYVQACGGTNTMTTSNLTTITTKLTAPPAVDFDCFSLDDGIYEDPNEKCSIRFFVCLAGNGIEQRCVGGTFFDTVSASCRLKQYVEACGGKSTTTAAPTNQTATTTPFLFVAYDCSTRTDGDYEDPRERCSASYVTCSNGKAFFRRCNPDELKYDVVSKSCLERQYVMWCGGKATTAGTTVASQTPPPPDRICDNATDGFYDNPLERCSVFFYSCVGGTADKISCPHGTKYDKYSTKCLNERYVKDCGGIATSLAPTPVTPTPTLTIPIKYPCDQRDDGNYADPDKLCSSIFYTCASGTAFRKHCGARGLRYDALTDKCLSSNYVRACGGTPTTSGPTGPPLTTKHVPDFNCQGIPQGEYGDPSRACSDLFFICHGQSKGLTQYCAPSTYYDQEKARCDFFDNVPECSGTPRTTKASTMSTTEKPTQPTTTPVYDCTGKMEGNYPDPKAECSPVYFTCAPGLGRTFEWRCPQKTYYDKELNQCLFYHQVPECSGTPRPSTVATTYGTTQPPLFDCSDQPDGNYALPGLVCPDHFYQCANRRSFLTPCPGVLKYKPEDDACVSAAEVKGC